MKECYLCGEILVKKKNRSKDHVPPDCIFPSEKPRNLITVPCCVNCNEKYRLLDEKMRNFFAILADKNSVEVGDIARRVVLRSLKLSGEFQSHTKPHPSLVDSAGNPRHLFFFDDKELNPWLVRVVKGLFYHKNGFRLSDEVIFKAGKLPELEPPSSDTFPMDEHNVWPAGTPEVGQKAELTREVSKQDVEMFTAISGDRNPLHYDEELANATKFGEI